MNLIKRIYRLFTESHEEYETRQASYAARAIRDYDKLVRDNNALRTVVNMTSIMIDEHSSQVIKNLALETLREIDS